MLTPYDVYVLYLSLKLHFTDPNYDFFKYSGKVRAKKESFNKRKDRYFFEKLSRTKNQKDLINYFVSNFIESTDPSKMWIGELKEKGEDNYINWKGRIQSLSYRFEQDLHKLIDESHLYESLTSKTNSHPKIIKYYLSEKISLETLIILNDITFFTNKLEESLSYDPIFTLVMNKFKKYRPFLNYDKQHFINLLKSKVLNN
jgi:hypothetical protein